MTRVPSRVNLDLRLLIACYVLEASAITLTLMLYKYADRLALLTARQLALLGVTLAILIAACVQIGRSFWRARSVDLKSFWLTLLTNLIAVVLLLSLGETAVRLAVVDTPLGPSLAGTRLVPRQWAGTVQRNLGLLRSAPPATAYFVADTLLGWTVGPGRYAHEGMYQSSTEGIRSARAGISYAAQPASQYVALVGDSFTFGFEGPYENTWGAVLDTALARGTVALNFGVDGYGVDQSILRYRRDARPWHPKVTVFGFVQHDFTRSLSVYYFITFPESGYPFSKPRFVLREGGDPQLVNVPLIDATEITRRASVADLPFIDLDLGYNSWEWRWQAWYSSYLLRYLASRFPRYPLPQPALEFDGLVRLNTALLRDFVRDAKADGTIPILVYFPSLSDFLGWGTETKEAVLASMRQSGIEVIDLTACVTAAGGKRVFIPGGHHYTKVGNQAVAVCLLPSIRQAIETGRPTTPAASP